VTHTFDPPVCLTAPLTGRSFLSFRYKRNGSVCLKTTELVFLTKAPHINKNIFMVTQLYSQEVLLAGLQTQYL